MNRSHTVTTGGAPAALAYPVARRCDQIDDYHGVRVADPYRWLEDTDSEETHAWAEAENKITRAFIDAIPGREAIKNRLIRIWDYETYGSPFKYGERTFFYKNSGLQNQYVLYVVDKPGDEPRVLLDPNGMSTDGTVALSGLSISDDGNLLAYGLSASGSDWQEWHVRDVATGQDRPDLLKWCKFTGASFTPDNKGFYYSRFDEPSEEMRFKANNFNQKLYYHAIGTPQSDDVLVYARPDHKEWMFSASVTEDGRYLIIYVHAGNWSANQIFYKDLSNPDSPVVELLNKQDALYGFVGNDGPVFWFTTTLNALRGRLIAIDSARSTTDHLEMTEIISEAAETLDNVSLVGNRFIANYLKDAHTQIKEFNLDGSLRREIPLPGIGSAGGFGGKQHDMETYYSFTSFTRPPTIYKLDLATGISTVYFQPKVDFDPDQFVTKLVFYTSKDQTRVPMFITYKKGLKRNGQNPTYLYGYGGFNNAMQPAFSITLLVFMEMGGIFAEAGIRGGGEYGEAWHEAGTKLKKQNVFDDFIAAGQWLIANKYTSTPKLAIGGGSNGGLLVGACMTQRPDLFGAACPAVGVMDMLRFHKFTAGHNWRSDYGSADDPDQFKALYAYSPLHNLKPGLSYPATLVTTADHDDRVVPGHSFKFAATLQACQAGPAPCLIRIETKAGHGAGKPTTKIIDEAADKWAFLVKVLNVPARKLRKLSA